ncbi:MAG TPA: class I SAM-dependent methyltransferase [Gaiellaceae bacterium]|nr:class I SAM-dependent methyltransferase [Gaiellaceae bacterium]
MTDLANRVDEVPERFVPELMRGELVEAEHLSRYWLGARLAAGRRVLDAGCGVGYGVGLLSAAGAAEVVGVDLSDAAIEAARAYERPGVTLQVADVCALPYARATFDLVVCFEVLEHVDEPERLLDELSRVLSDDGILAVSTPNRDVYPPGNPHHRHELTPAELRSALAARFEHVELAYQDNLLATTLLYAESVATEEQALLDDVEVRTIVPRAAGDQPYVVGLASRSPFERPREQLVLTNPHEVRRWLGLYDEQRAVLERQAVELRRAGDDVRRLIEAQRLLRDAEAALARVPDLEQELADARATIEEQGHAIDYYLGVIDSLLARLLGRRLRRIAGKVIPRARGQA